jgi:hypothetical protein
LRTSTLQAARGIAAANRVAAADRCLRDRSMTKKTATGTVRFQD